MEYLVGSIMTIVSLLLYRRMFRKIIKDNIPVPIFSQSRKVSLMKDYLFNYFEEEEKEVETQSNKHSKRNSIKAFFWGGSVYWIENGFLVTALLQDNGIDETTKKKVDTHSLDKVELEKMIFIVDKLTEGNKNDSGDSGNKNV